MICVVTTAALEAKMENLSLKDQAVGGNSLEVSVQRKSLKQSRVLDTYGGDGDWNTHLVIGPSIKSLAYGLEQEFVSYFWEAPMASILLW